MCHDPLGREPMQSGCSIAQSLERAQLLDAGGLHGCRRGDPGRAQRLHDGLIDAGQRGKRLAALLGRFGLRALRLHLRLALDVDPHAGQLCRKPRVLTLLPDRERELIVRHDDERDGLILALHRFAHDDGGDLRRRQRARHERRRVV